MAADNFDIQGKALVILVTQKLEPCCTSKVLIQLMTQWPKGTQYTTIPNITLVTSRIKIRAFHFVHIFTIYWKEFGVWSQHSFYSPKRGSIISVLPNLEEKKEILNKC